MKTFRNKALLGVAVVAAIAAGTIGFTANADSVEAKATPIHTKDGHGSITFYKSTDNFVVKDHKKDGRGVRAIYTIGGQGNDYMYNNKGANTSAKYNRNFREGTKLKIQICLTNNGTPIGSTCSGWKSRTA